MAGRITIDTNALHILVLSLKTLSGTIDSQNDFMPSLNDQLSTAITGTAPSISYFQGKFSSWAQILGTLAADMDEAYTLLLQVYNDAQSADTTLKSAV